MSTEYNQDATSKKIKTKAVNTFPVSNSNQTFKDKFGHVFSDLVMDSQTQEKNYL